MAKKKSKSFGKHVYVLIAVVVLAIAAGVMSYAAVPPGAATHGDLYTDNIYNKSAALIQVSAPTWFYDGIIASTCILPGCPAEASGAMGVDPTIGVIGYSVGSTNVGKLGTANAGVEGASVLNRGKLGTGTSAVEGIADGSGNGIYGQSNTGIGVLGYSSSNYAGFFNGSKGLYASKIEFGSAAFQQATSGLFIVGARAGPPSCNAICLTHGLGCITSLRADGTGSISCFESPAVLRYCWCGV
ncbi:MAG: hypothetical protein KJ955_08340 [Nanoarchaeota archaeon]|nr:hypothetical protein [Nanoarchaeota archaeon]